MISPIHIPISLALALVIQAPLGAHPPIYLEQGSPRVSVEFLVAGSPLPQSGALRGERFVAVPRWGVEYEIRITNHERRSRVLFVIGVDGLSVIDGSPATQESGGYVLEPGQSHRIRGWRRGLDRVAAFTFTSRGDSYAGRTGHRDHIGEVWVWAIGEMRPGPPAEIAPTRPQRAENEKARRRALDAERETGTGYGDELVDLVRTTHFVRSDWARRLNFRYGLRPRIVPPYDRPHQPPAEPFTPPPPGWGGQARK